MAEGALCMQSRKAQRPSGIGSVSPWRTGIGACGKSNRTVGPCSTSCEAWSGVLVGLAVWVMRRPTMESSYDEGHVGVYQSGSTDPRQIRSPLNLRISASGHRRHKPLHHQHSGPWPLVIEKANVLAVDIRR